jgi:hypothetical protein
LFLFSDLGLIPRGGYAKIGQNISGSKSVAFSVTFKNHDSPNSKMGLPGPNSFCEKMQMALPDSTSLSFEQEMVLTAPTPVSERPKSGPIAASSTADMGLPGPTSNTGGGCSSSSSSCGISTTGGHSPNSKMGLSGPISLCERVKEKEKWFWGAN